MANAFKTLDMFGVTYAFKTQGQDKYRTSIGACFTLVVLAIASIFIFVYGTDFFYSTNPSVLDDDFVHEEAQEIYPTLATHPFMITVRRNDNYDLTGLPIRLNVVYRDWKRNKKTGASEANCIVRSAKTKCSNTVLKIDPEFSKEVLENWWCLDFEKVKQKCAEKTKDPNYEPYIGGTSGDDRIGQVLLDISNNERDDDGNLLYQGKLADIKELGSFVVQIRYPKFYLRKEEKYNALTTKSELEGFSLQPQSFRFEYRYMKQVRLDDDTGWINENIETSRSIDLDKVVPQYYTNLLDKETNVSFYTTSFWLNRNEKVYKRRFMKLSEVISRVAGTMSPIIVIFSVVISIYNRFFSDYELIQEMFDNFLKPAKTETQLNTIVNESKSEEQPVKVEELKEIPELSFFSYYFWVCRQRTSLLRSREFFKRAREYKTEKLDVKSLLDHYEKFQKLSEMTLTNEQLEELVRGRKTIIFNKH